MNIQHFILFTIFIKIIETILQLGMIECHTKITILPKFYKGQIYKTKLFKIKITTIKIKRSTYIKLNKFTHTTVRVKTVLIYSIFER